MSVLVRRGPGRPVVLGWVVALMACAAVLGCDGGGGGDTGGGGDGGGSTTTETASSGGGGAGGGDGGSGGAGGSTTTTSAQGAGGGGAQCTQARTDALGPVDKVSTGQVIVLDAGKGEVFVDASAGGIGAQKENPWVYLALATRTRVDVTDVSADAADAWDVAIKRPILRSNGGDGGLAGKGGAVMIPKAFDDVTAADAQGAAFAEDDWFDDECALATDQTGAIKTVFDGWYAYEGMKVSPAPGTTWLVRGGNGTSIFKLAVLSYYANPDGSEGMAGGKYVVRIATLVE